MYFKVCKKMRQQNYRYLDLYIHIFYENFMFVILRIFFFITTIEFYNTKEM